MYIFLKFVIVLFELWGYRIESKFRFEEFLRGWYFGWF